MQQKQQLLSVVQNLVAPTGKKVTKCKHLVMVSSPGNDRISLTAPVKISQVKKKLGIMSGF